MRLAGLAGAPVPANSLHSGLLDQYLLSGYREEGLLIQHLEILNAARKFFLAEGWTGLPRTSEWLNIDLLLSFIPAAPAV